jgi:hypothetical protein
VRAGKHGERLGLAVEVCDLWVRAREMALQKQPAIAARWLSKLDLQIHDMSPALEYGRTHVPRKSVTPNIH